MTVPEGQAAERKTLMVNPTDTRTQDRFRIGLIAGFILLAMCLLTGIFGRNTLLMKVSSYLFLSLLTSTLTYAWLYQKSLFAFLIRRLGLMVVTLVGITLVTFLIIRAAPGDPSTIASGMGGEGGGGGGVDSSKLAREAGQTKLKLLNMLQEYTFTASAADPDGDPVKLVFDWGDTSAQREKDPVPSGQTGSDSHSWSSEGDYEVRVQARDINGAESEWSDPAVIRIRENELPPDKPSRPQGTVEGLVGEMIAITCSGTHPAGKEIQFRFDWDDSSVSPPTDPVRSGEKAKGEHAWMKSGVYRVRVKAQGAKGGVSGWSEDFAITIRDSHFKLIRPVRLESPGFARVGEEVTFTSTAPANDVPLQLEVNWGDGEITKTAPQDPKGKLSATHSWKSEGRWPIKARVVDDKGSVSDWSNEFKLPVALKNHRPDKPAPPRGPSTGSIRTSLLYQYWRWLNRLVRLDFDESISQKKKVMEILPERMQRTLFLDGFSFIIIYLIAVPIGIYSSTRRRSVQDKSMTVVLFLLYSLPTFWVGTMLIVLTPHFRNLPVAGFSCQSPEQHWLRPSQQTHLLLFVLLVLAAIFLYHLARRLGAPGIVGLLSIGLSIPIYVLAGRWMGEASPYAAFLIDAAVLLGIVLVRPKTGGVSPVLKASIALGIAIAVTFLTAQLLKLDLIWHALLPILCLTYPGLAALSRYSRSGMMEVVRQDYIRTARAKGLSEGAVIYKHALRNGMIPILTLMATLLPSMISGSIIVEYIFSVRGMGQLAWEAVTQRDYNVLMAVSTISALLTLVGILLADILYVLVDPRISFESVDA